jgi:hypothetical protein
MNQFGNSPCWYCKYYYSYSSKCLKRITTHPSELELCPTMDLDNDQVILAIEYFKDIQHIS